MDLRKLLEYALIALIAVILGSLTGWYLFIRRETAQTVADGVARGYTVQTFGSGRSPSFFTQMTGAVFGNGTSETALAPSAPGTDTAATSTGKQPPELWQVQAAPVAGMTFIGSGASLRLRYVDRATGRVFEADPRTGEIVRLENTLTPKIYEALLSSSGKVIERTLSASGDATTVIGTVSGSAATGTALARIELPSVTRITFSPSGAELFYLVNEGSGVSGYRALADGSKASRVFSSPIMNWRVSWIGGATSSSMIILTTGATDGLSGSAYELLGSGELRALQYGLPGLTYLRSPLGASLWSVSSPGLQLYAQASDTSASIRLPIATIADKCAWAPNERTAYCGVPQVAPARGFLGAWYRGDVHTADAVWRLQPGAGEATRIYTPQTGQSIDVDSPSVDESGSYVAFINAADRTLWVLRLEK